MPTLAPGVDARVRAAYGTGPNSIPAGSHVTVTGVRYSNMTDDTKDDVEVEVDLELNGFRYTKVIEVDFAQSRNEDFLDHITLNSANVGSTHLVYPERSLPTDMIIGISDADVISVEYK